MDGRLSYTTILPTPVVPPGSGIYDFPSLISTLLTGFINIERAFTICRALAEFPDLKAGQDVRFLISQSAE